MMAKRKRTEQQQHRVLRGVEVDNPYWSRAHDGEATNPRRISAVVNIRESAVVMLYTRGRLDDAQLAASNKFCALWEAMGGKGASAIDYGREPVDGGRRSDPITLRQIAAADELRRCRRCLGRHGYWLISRICGEGYSLHEVVHPRRSKRAKLTAADDLRHNLDLLCEMWGLTSRKR